MVALAVLAVLHGGAHSVWAARIEPPSLLFLFQNGYGVVAGEVAESRCVTAARAYPAIYQSTFQVREVVAQPATGGPFALRTGDRIALRLTSGYACQIEDGASLPSKGKLYYLIIRPAADGGFEHVDGASAVRSVEKFDTGEDEYYRRVRSLAAEPEAKQLDAWLDVLQRRSEPDRIRAQALGGISSKLWPVATDPTAAKARDSLLRIWQDPGCGLSLALRQQLDSVLQQTDRQFAGSAVRRDVWLDRLLRWTPDMATDDNHRDNLAFWEFRDLAEAQPDAVGERLAAELPNRRWPALYRRDMALGLLTAYRYAPKAAPTWDATLGSYFVDLMRNGDPFPVRVGAGDLEYFAGLVPSSRPAARRLYLPGADVRAAIEFGTARLTKESGRAGANYEYALAARELKKLLRLLDESR